MDIKFIKFVVELYIFVSYHSLQANIALSDMEHFISILF